MSTNITSKTNSLYKEVKRLLSKSSNEYFVIEGKKLLTEALNSKLKVEKILLSSDNKNISEIHKLCNKNCELVYMQSDLISSLYTTDTKPKGDDLVLAVAKPPKWNINELITERKNFICLVNIQDPGNVGTIFRLVLAFNFGGVLLVDSSANPLNTKVVRASAGAVFKMPYFVFSSFREIADLFKKDGYRFVATSNKGKSLTDYQFHGGTVLIFGNEGRGLSEKVLELADEVITVLHESSVESLNVATAVSIILWDVYSSKIKV